MKTPFAIEEKLRGQIEDTGYLHKALPLDLKNSLEQIGLAKKVLKINILCDMKTANGWSSSGPGTLTHSGRVTPAGNVSMRMEAPTAWDCWPEENPEGDYTPFFRQHAILSVGGQDWNAYNRIHFWIYPDCPGVYAVNIDLLYQNDGAVKIPDAYNREADWRISSM
jgi:hypothetical protein